VVAVTQDYKVNKNMLLKEFFYFDKDGNSFGQDNRYDAERDISVVKQDDTRKTRLTLSQINTIRKTAEARELEQAKDLEFVKTMYGQPPADQAGTL
jgi:hypothetical protein